MNTDVILAEMRALLSRRGAVLRRIERGADGPCGIRQPRLDGMPRGGGGSAGAEGILGYMSALVRERDEIDRELDACRRRVEPLIHALPRGPHRLVMRLRYLEWHTVTAVANGAGYERRYTYKLLAEGERRLAGLGQQDTDGHLRTQKTS